jgi:cytochrome oxidase Cu insertion factor (SCO1/SenC/PrrC family)
VDRLQVVLVSVDPNRDTPNQLKQYLGYFDKDFVGVAGTIEDTQKLANGLSIPFIPADTSKPGYTVDHSGNLAVWGRMGVSAGSFVRRSTTRSWWRSCRGWSSGIDRGLKTSRGKSQRHRALARGFRL